MAQRRDGQAARDRRNTAIAAAIVVGAVATTAVLAARSGQGSSYAPAAPADTSKPMLFGGQGDRTYLGCLNCSQYDGESVSNEYGEFGSHYSQTSILNPYSEFGSRYSPYGACNPYATDPPIIVDAAGTPYGRISVNTSQPVSPRWREWISRVCDR